MSDCKGLSQHLSPAGVGSGTAVSRRSVILGAAAGACLLAGSWNWPTRALSPTPARRPVAAGGDALGRPTSAPGLEATEPEPKAPTPEAWQPTFIPRRHWAAEVPAANHLPLGSVERLTIHHTGADTRALGLSDLEAVRSIERYHRDERGWACIGYHFLIGDDGVVYEGRPPTMQGAHVRDANERNIGIACIGAFDDRLPSRPQLASLMFLVQAIRRRAGLPLTRLYGHRDLSPSTCPGDRLYAWMQQTWFGEAQG